MSLLELEGISKRFFGVYANQDISLSVAKGRVLGLIGENGAGKSTLMNIIGGVHQPDDGSMTLNGQPYAPRKPADASHHKIAFIHQELNLFGNLSIAENIFIDEFPKRAGLIDRRTMRARSRELLASLDLDLAPSTPAGQLAPGERQLVEIVKALHSDAQLIIFDEPTTSLTARETQRLFKVIAQLRDEGRAIIYISHILSDVLKLADDVAVLRDGRLTGSGPKDDFDIHKMITLMIGRELEQLFPERTPYDVSEPQQTTLEVRGISEPGIVKDISFEIQRGEIWGLFGLMGSGRSELARILFGLDRAGQGEIILNGQHLHNRSPAQSIAAGMAFVTEDRRAEGLMLESSIANNISLVALDAYAHTPLRVLADEDLLTAASTTAQSLKLKSGNIRSQAAKSLSGGNQQKVVISKWLLSKPVLFIVDEPTRGVDVGAKFEIYSIIAELAAAGNSVLFISSELEELMGMCDRILVMSQGELQADFAPPFEQTSILASAFREELPA
ncbi:MAG: sugar ABC transporter ATP-binding protein [Deinococcota bacterium]